jgi:hypothetical protein
MTLSNPDHSNRFNKLADNITYFAVRDFSGQPLEDANGLMLVDVPVKVKIYKKREGSESKIIHFMIRRESLTDRWFIDKDAIYEALK